MSAQTFARESGFFAGLRRLAETIHVAFCKLNQIQFDAPWNPRRRGC